MSNMPSEKFNNDNCNNNIKNEKGVKPIEYNPSKLEKVLKMSDEETIAKAIRDLLLRDKENGNY